MVLKIPLDFLLNSTELSIKSVWNIMINSNLNAECLHMQGRNLPIGGQGNNIQTHFFLQMYSILHGYCSIFFIPPNWLVFLHEISLHIPKVGVGLSSMVSSLNHIYEPLTVCMLCFLHSLHIAFFYYSKTDFILGSYYIISSY